MANHTIDCEFCGHDLRLSERCCPEQIAKVHSERVARKQQQDRREALMYKYGLSSPEDALSLIGLLDGYGDSTLAGIAATIANERLARQQRQAACKHK